MMDLIKHPELGEIRTVIKKGEPLFCVTDICAALGFAQLPESATRNLDDDEKGAEIFRTPGGLQKMASVNESGLYTLIMRSNKPSAKRFRKWVTSEVLPSIRRNGFYVHPDYLGKKDMKLLQKKLAEGLSNYLSENDMRKIAKKFGVDRYYITRVLDGRLTHNAIMQECQKRALANKENEENAYHPHRICEVLNILSK